jgi:uncharacterized protein involved in type VI secretion and phage assembly
MSRQPGVVSGIVSSVDDPANLGRVQVQFDWMDGAPQSYWARVAAPMAGGKRGAFFMPELQDEVLVAFDHGDVSHPYIVGYCWSGADEPPFSVNPKRRGIVSVLGHQLLFDDNDDAKKITLSTPSGYQLTLDELHGMVTLITKSNVAIVLQDTPPSVSLVLSGPGSAVLFDATGLSVVTPTGTIDLIAPLVTISGAVKVEGPVTATAFVTSP